MKYRKTILPNGLRVITVPTKGNPSVSVMILVETGSNYETKSENGLSHFLEHMVFKGTKKRPKSIDISCELDGLGAQSNAFTSNEFTSYYAKAEKRRFKKLLDIVSDIYLNPTLPEKELEKERGVILQEISMYEDLPQKNVWRIFFRLLHGDTPAGRNILGSRENVRKFRQKDFEEYRRKHYVPAKTFILVAGDVEDRLVLKEVKKIFGSIPRGRKVGKEPVKNTQSKPQLLIQKKQTDQTHLIIGFRTFDAKDKRRFALAVLSAILGQGMSSRLFQRMREEMGVCYYVYTSDDAYTDHGYLAISIGADNLRVEESVRAILDECRKIKTRGVSEDELKRAKDYMVGNLFMGLETTDALSLFYAEQESLKGKALTPYEIEEAIRKVSAKEVLAVAKDIFKNKGLNMAVLGDIKNPPRLRRLLVL